MQLRLVTHGYNKAPNTWIRVSPDLAFDLMIDGVRVETIDLSDAVDGTSSVKAVVWRCRDLNIIEVYFSSTYWSVYVDDSADKVVDVKALTATLNAGIALQKSPVAAVSTKINDSDPIICTLSRFIVSEDMHK